MKLLSKFTRINTLVIVLVFLISSAFLNYFVKKTVINELDETLTEIKARAKLFTNSKRTIPGNSPVDDYRITYVPSKTYDPTVYFTTVSKHIPGKKKAQNFRELHYSDLINGKIYVVSIQKPIEGMRDLAQQIAGFSIITVLLVILFVAFISRFVLKKLWDPFFKSLSVVNDFQVSNGNELHLPASTTTEFEYMNNILKRTTTKALNDYISLKEFTENASHELQTPLSIISTKLDLLIQDERLTQRQEKHLMTAYSALKRMSHLNQSLLLSAKIGNEQFTHLQDISLDETISEKLNLFQELWEGQLEVNSFVRESHLKMNSDLSEILIDNLLSNATKHNVRGGFISIDLRQGQFIVSNSGSQMPLDPARLFTRFYKPEQTGNGNGLGLSIIKQICDSSGIRIKYLFKDNSHNFSLTW